MQPDNLWLIHEPALENLKGLLAVSPQAIMTRPGRRVDGSAKMVTRGNVAIIPIHGVIVPRSNGLTEFLSEFTDITTLDKFALDFQAAIDSPSVSAVVLDVHSPGGLITAVKQVADLVHDARSQKRVVSYIQGIGASAAYFIGSSASSIVLDPMALVGSIGTVFEFELPGESTQKWVRHVEIVSEQSPMKRVDPTTEAGKAEWQRLANELTDVFIDTVARNRRTSREMVLSDFGRGSMRVGADAVRHGMADTIGSLEEVIFQLQTNPQSFKAASAAEEIEMSLIEKIRALVNGESSEPEEPKADTPDATALAEENAKLKEQLASHQAVVQAAMDEAKKREAEAEAQRVDSAVKSFMAEHGPKMGKEFYDTVESAYRKAEEAKDAGRIAEITAIVKAVPPVGQQDRVKAGGEKVDREVAKAAGEIDHDSDAERDAKIQERAKKDGVSYDVAYRRVIAEERGDGAA